MFRRLRPVISLVSQSRRNVCSNRGEVGVAAAITQDAYGAPDPKSNLRLVTFYVPPNESENEKEYRLQRARVQQWNHEFWTTHNIEFIQEKEAFVTSCMAKKGNNEPLTADDLSDFYRRFLDDNWEKHYRYNIEWHKKNLKLLWPGIKANMSKLKRQLAAM